MACLVCISLSVLSDYGLKLRKLCPVCAINELDTQILIELLTSKYNSTHLPSSDPPFLSASTILFSSTIPSKLNPIFQILATGWVNLLRHSSIEAVELVMTMLCGVRTVINFDINQNRIVIMLIDVQENQYMLVLVPSLRYTRASDVNNSPSPTKLIRSVNSQMVIPPLIPPICPPTPQMWPVSQWLHVIQRLGSPTSSHSASSSSTASSAPFSFHYPDAAQAHSSWSTPFVTQITQSLPRIEDGDWDMELVGGSLFHSTPNTTISSDSSFIDVPWEPTAVSSITSPSDNMEHFDTSLLDTLESFPGKLCCCGCGGIVKKSNILTPRCCHTGKYVCSTDCLVQGYEQAVLAYPPNHPRSSKNTNGAYEWPCTTCYHIYGELE